jgi:predicted transcriptional regulator
MIQRPSSRVRTVSSNSEWDIYVVRSTPAKKWLGTVEASDVDAAIAEAAWRFDVKEPSQLMAVRRRP